MDPRITATTRRWPATIAIVAALSLFVALIAGSSLRPQLAAAALPEPVAWTHYNQAPQADATHAQVHAGIQSISHASQGLSPGSTPMDKKPFHSMWMTHDRPTSWAGLAAHSGWLALPASFAAPDGAPGDVELVASATAPANRDVLLQLCVIRC